MAKKVGISSPFLSDIELESAGDWWRVFSDPTLNRLETQAYTANQNIRLAVDRIDDATAQVQIAAADLYPNVNLASSATRSRTTATGPVEAERILGQVPGTSGPTPVFTGSNGPVFTGQPISLTSWDFQILAQMRWELIYSAESGGTSRLLERKPSKQKQTSRLRF